MKVVRWKENEKNKQNKKFLGIHTDLDLFRFTSFLRLLDRIRRRWRGIEVWRRIRHCSPKFSYSFSNNNNFDRTEVFHRFLSLWHRIHRLPRMIGLAVNRSLQSIAMWDELRSLLQLCRFWTQTLPSSLLHRFIPKERGSAAVVVFHSFPFLVVIFGFFRPRRFCRRSASLRRSRLFCLRRRSPFLAASLHHLIRLLWVHALRLLQRIWWLSAQSRALLLSSLSANLISARKIKNKKTTFLPGTCRCLYPLFHCVSSCVLSLFFWFMFSNLALIFLREPIISLSLSPVSQYCVCLFD